MLQKYKIIIAVFVGGIFLTGCVTKNACDRKFPPQITNTTITKDSIVFVRDSIWLEPEQIVLHDSIPCPDYHKEITQGTHHATVIINKGKLTVICKEDSLLEVIEYQKHIMNTISSQVKVLPAVVQWTTHWYDVACRWVAGILTLFFIGFIASKIK